MRTVEHEARDTYRSRFGESPAIVASAPGRVNLIGDHTDYNGGFVLPCAIELRTACALGAGPGILYSLDFDDEQPADGCEGGSWAAYPRGVAWAFADAGLPIPSFNAVFRGDVPVGSGLSSSAAIEAATALALDRFAGLDLERKRLALLCQRAENAFVGVQSGIMDQYASLLSQEGAALLIDCASLESRAVPFDLESAELSLVVCDTRTKRSLTETGYNERRAECEGAARLLGVRLLREAQIEDLDRLHGVEQKRARHVLSENARVLAAAVALDDQDFRAFGQLMYESHQSLRDEFEVSRPEFDAFVEVARGFDALGARLTGAGFGGCAIALLHEEGVSELQAGVRQRFATRGFTAPVFYSVLPSAGGEVT